MVRAYPAELKERILRRLLEPSPPSLAALATQYNISNTTMSRWSQALRQQGHLMATDSTNRAPADKLRIVIAAQNLDAAKLGALLRTEGVTLDELESWRHQLLAAFDAPAASDLRDLRQQLAASNKDNQQLQKELLRKDKALAEAAALLVLSKKVRQIWEEDEDAPTPGKTGNASSLLLKKP